MPHTEASTSPLRRSLRAIRARLDGIFNPYRPELHYMRGPGPKCRERQDRAREAQPAPAPAAGIGDKPAGAGKSMPSKYCPKCLTLMVLERVAPAFGPLPELRTYKCLHCGCVIDEDVGR